MIVQRNDLSVIRVSKLRLVVIWSLNNRLRRGWIEPCSSRIESHSIRIYWTIQASIGISTVNTVNTASPVLMVQFVKISNWIVLIRILGMRRRGNTFIWFLERVMIWRSVCFVSFHLFKELFNIFSFIFEQVHKSVRQ